MPKQDGTSSRSDSWPPRVLGAARATSSHHCGPPTKCRTRPPTRVHPDGGTCEPPASSWSLVRTDPATESVPVTHVLGNRVS